MNKIIFNLNCIYNTISSGISLRNYCDLKIKEIAINTPIYSSNGCYVKKINKKQLLRRDDVYV